MRSQITEFKDAHELLACSSQNLDYERIECNINKPKISGFRQLTIFSFYIFSFRVVHLVDFRIGILVSLFAFVYGT